LELFQACKIVKARQDGSMIQNLRLALLAHLLVLSCFIPARNALAVGKRMLSGHVPSAVSTAESVDRLAPSQRLRLAIGLPLRNSDELNLLLDQLYDPASSQYHQYLTPEQFTQRFGPTQQDYDAVIAFMRANGFTITAVHPNRVLLDVSGSVEQIEKTFHTTLRLYRHPLEARSFYAPDIEPEVDLAVPLLHISGLDNYLLPRPASIIHGPADQPKPVPAMGSGPGGSYRGGDFKAAYASGVTGTGTGQMVGLLEFDGYYANDIASYASQAGLSPVPPLINILVDGGTGAAGPNNIEVALDIEMVISMAKGLSAVLVYEGFDGNDILNRMANDNLAKQLSASWTFQSDGTTTQIFQQYAAQGQSYFNASGDGDAYLGGLPSPTDNAYITSVGGTTLSTSGPQGVWTGETAWNWGLVSGNYVGTGGGISANVPIPSYQQTVDMSLNNGSTILRNSPDVSMVADNIYIVYNNGHGATGIGGTSVGAPLWAAYIALVNQQALNSGLTTVGFVNPAIYVICQGPGYGTNFHDTVTGNNATGSSGGLYSAVAGYDLCTGWGSPIGQNLINTLAPRPNARVILNAGTALASESCAPGNNAIDPGETVQVLFSLKNIGAVRTTNLVATLQADSGILSPSSPQTYGILQASGNPVNRQFTFTANGICGSLLTATLQLQDGADDLGTVTFSFRVGKSVIDISQGFDSAAAPALPSGWTTNTSGAGIRWVTTATLRDSTPNSAFAGESDAIGVTELISPLIPIAGTNALLSFKTFFNTETDPADPTRAYDGGVLEISVAGSAFMDILAASGSFITNGYNKTISDTNDNPLVGRQAWGGLSGGFIPVVVTLPASTAGQSIQLKWRFGTDTQNGYGGLGWYIDSVSILDGYSCCGSGVVAPTIELTGYSSSPYGVSVSLNSVFGAAYTLQYKNTLDDASWTSVLPSVAGSGGVITLLDPAGATFPTRFYRVSAQ
jgi:hypothetical protein